MTPPAAVQRKCHRDVLAGLKAKDPEKTGKAVSEYLQQAQQMLSVLLSTLDSSPDKATVSK